MPENPAPAQVEASRRNGASARGPVTPEGKVAALAQLGNLQSSLLLAQPAARTLFLAREGVATAAAAVGAFRKAPAARPPISEAAAQPSPPATNAPRSDQPEQLELPSEPEKGPVTHS